MATDEGNRLLHPVVNDSGSRQQTFATQATWSEDAWEAARDDRFDTVWEELGARAGLVNHKNEDGESMLHWFSLHGNERAVRALLDYNADVNAAANNLQTPMFWAIVNGHVNIVLQLIDVGANVEAADSLGATPLILAIQHHRRLIALLLLEKGAQRTSVDAYGCGPVHWAAYKGDVDMLRLLKQEGFIMNDRDANGFTPLHRAATAPVHSFAAAQLLIEECGMRPDEPTCPPAPAQSLTALDLIQPSVNPAVANFILHTHAKFAQRDAAARSSGVMARLKILRYWLDDNVFSKASAVSRLVYFFWCALLVFVLFTYWNQYEACSTPIASRLTSVLRRVLPVTHHWLYLHVSFVLALGGLLVSSILLRVNDAGRVSALPGGVEAIVHETEWASTPALRDELICFPTKAIKPLRSKFCSVSQYRVAQFDHFCTWVNTPIGAGNRKYFLSFLVFHCIVCCLFVLLLLPVLQTRFAAAQSSLIFVMNFIVSFRQFQLAAALLVNIFGYVFTYKMLDLQLQLIALNLTTNELLNLHRYAEFWEYEAAGGSGELVCKFSNPYTQGSSLLNFKEFWGYVQPRAVSLQDIVQRRSATQQNVAIAIHSRAIRLRNVRSSAGSSLEQLGVDKASFSDALLRVDESV